jgi:hypothetical protein
MGLVKSPTGIEQGGLAMEKVLMIGADVHDENVLTKFAVGRGAMAMRSFRNNRKGRQPRIRFFQEWAERVRARRIVFGYEASCSGYVLRDELVAAGIECHVLTPSKMERSPTPRRRKTVERDAERVLEVRRGFVRAGNRLPAAAAQAGFVREQGLFRNSDSGKAGMGA